VPSEAVSGLASAGAFQASEPRRMYMDGEPLRLSKRLRRLERDLKADGPGRGYTNPALWPLYYLRVAGMRLRFKRLRRLPPFVMAAWVLKVRVGGLVFERVRMDWGRREAQGDGAAAADLQSRSTVSLAGLCTAEDSEPALRPGELPAVDLRFPGTLCRTGGSDSRGAGPRRFTTVDGVRCTNGADGVRCISGAEASVQPSRGGRSAPDGVRVCADASLPDPCPLPHSEPACKAGCDGGRVNSDAQAPDGPWNLMATRCSGVGCKRPPGSVPSRSACAGKWPRVEARPKKNEKAAHPLRCVVCACLFVLE
jgi:hypothetical protein